MILPPQKKSASPEETLVQLEDYARSNNLTRAQVAQQLDIPIGTLKNWFQRGRTRRSPSGQYLTKIRNFLMSVLKREDEWTELWQRILQWWSTQHRYDSPRALATEIGWDSDSLAHFLETTDIPPRLVIDSIARAIGFPSLATSSFKLEGKRRGEKVRSLLLFLEDELRWFRDGPKEARDIFRTMLDSRDIGYITSLLTMLSDEGKFNRWLTLTTNRFAGFRNKEGK